MTAVNTVFITDLFDVSVKPFTNFFVTQEEEEEVVTKKTEVKTEFNAQEVFLEPIVDVNKPLDPQSWDPVVDEKKYLTAYISKTGYKGEVDILFSEVMLDQ